MEYQELFTVLKNSINYSDNYCEPLSDLSVHTYTFKSQNKNIIPGEDVYTCPTHNFTQKAPATHIWTDKDSILDVVDSHVSENSEFRFHVFKPNDGKKTKQVILLLHGFNEKNWTKYFPWAYQLMKETGKAVILFPMTFHMNRALPQWSDPRLMTELQAEHKKNYPNIKGSSFVNIAISTRLRVKPQRFIWSGLLTYYDIMQLVEEIKEDSYDCISADATYDFFAYSIGGLLAQTLMLTNHNHYFDNAKMALFCSGSVFSRLTPVCKFIMDSETEQTLYRFIIGYLDVHIKNDTWMGHFLSEKHTEGYTFMSLLNYNKLMDYRENLFRNAYNKIYAIALEKDFIIPYYEVVNTLQGRKRDIPIIVDVDDFPYNYKHEDPFPLKASIQVEVNSHFESAFHKLGAFLK